MQKKLVYEPFDRQSGLELFDSDCCCSATTNLNEMNLEELKKEKRELEEGIMDWETVIDIELSSAKRKGEPNESLVNSRRRRQQLIMELRMVKAQIKMMIKSEKELSVI